LGSLRYFYAIPTVTDARGQFHAGGLEPGRGYLLMVRKNSEVRQFDPAADSPKDPEKRKPVIATTFYPGVVSIEDATPIILRPGETREGIDVTVVHSTSFCVDGKAVAGKDTGPLDLRLERPNSTTQYSATETISRSFCRARKQIRPMARSRSAVCQKAGGVLP
jgi:hypothetical protein